MKKWLKWLIKQRRLLNRSPALVNIDISKSALFHNLNKFRGLAQKREIAPVLKANAYGHGLSLISHILKDEKVPFFVIDSYFEATALRNEGIETPLLIIGYVRPENIDKSKLKNIVYVISAIDSLKSIKSKAHIHLKIDTGMHRQGILPEEEKEAVKIIKNNSNIILEGICSHFADADNTDTKFTKNQINIWSNSVKYFKEQFPTLKYWHISNTSGIIFKEAQANLIRLGIGLYGIIEMKGIDLKPVLEMKTIISGIKKIKKGESIGYGCTFKSKEDMTIALLPLGYYEGIDRRLSNKGFVKIENEFCPIVGRVSMDITVIDISKIKNIKLGDEVTVISKIKQDKNSIENIAKICNTIPYEIAVHIAQHLRRVCC